MKFDSASCDFSRRFSDEPFPSSLLDLGEYPENYDEILNQVGEEIRLRKYLTKIDISALAAWKRLDLSTKWMMNLQSMSDAVIKNLSRCIFESDLGKSDRILRTAASGIPGFGGTFAVASTVLTAFDPLNFGITDRRSRESLRHLGCSCGNQLDKYSIFLEHVAFMRDRLSQDLDGQIVTSRFVDQILFAQTKSLRTIFLN